MKSSAILCMAILAGCVLLADSPARAQQIPQSAFGEMRWRNVGPFRGGRTRAVAGVPSQPNVFYAGAVNGGVWKTEDYGETWRPIFDDQPTGSIGAIAVAPSDPNIVYVASGEGLQRPDLSVGDGVYKSTDAGKTWTHLGLRDAQQIPALVVDPRDANRLFAAALGHPYGPNAERGIFLSTDGGANWKKVLGENPDAGGSAVELEPNNPDVIYASLWDAREGPWEDGNTYSGPGGGLFKSTDGGMTWHALTNGLPKDVVQINIGIAQSDSTRVYAAVASGATGGDLGIYRSDDGGENWVQATTDKRPSVRIGGGDLPVIKVDPKNAGVVYTTSTVTWRSEDGGKTWRGIKGAPGGDDYQNLWINPNDAKTMCLVSDQGASVTVNRGETWSSWYNQPTAQLYHAIADNSFPYRLCAGQQESGSVCISSRGNDGAITFRDWHPAGVIEYGYAAPDPLNPNIVYGAGRNDVSRYDYVTGQVQHIGPVVVMSDKYRAHRTQPIMFSPADPHVLLYALNYMYKTTDGGKTWQTISPDLTRPHDGIPASLGDMAKNDKNADKQRGVIYSIAPSFNNVDTIWTGTDDGFIWLTRDGGKNWKNITPPELTPWSKVTQISASHFDEQMAFASVSRFRIDDRKPYIYRTRDGGKSWQKITNGLPDNAAADTVREDPVRKGLLFAGTENAVWVSFDEGDHWQSLQLNLPHTANRDLWIHDGDLIVATHGRGFWILDDIAPLRQMTEKIAKAEEFLFKPAPAYRVRRDINPDTPLPPETPMGQNPPAGAIIDYYLGTAASGPVTLEILDSAGKLMRRFSSTDDPGPSEEELNKTVEVPLYWLRPTRVLSAAAGMHRWVWDLHYPTPETVLHEYPIAAIPHDTLQRPLGPRAVPGTYTARLIVGGRSFSESFVVKMDPRMKVTTAELASQTKLEQLVAAGMDRDFAALSEVRALRAELKKAAPSATGALADAVAALDQKAAALEGGPANPFAPPSAEKSLTKLSTDITTVYNTVDSADFAPTADQERTSRELESALTPLLARWKQMKEKDVPALNDQLTKAGLPAIGLKAN